MHYCDVNVLKSVSCCKAPAKKLYSLSLIISVRVFLIAAIITAILVLVPVERIYRLYCNWYEVKLKLMCNEMTLQRFDSISNKVKSYKIN